MTETEYRNQLRAMTADEHYAYFEQNGERLRKSLKGTSQKTFTVCTQEAVNDLRDLLHWQEFTADNVPPLKTDLLKHEFFVYQMEENAPNAVTTNWITIVCRDSECYTPVQVERVDYSSGYHKAAPTLVEMQNNESGNCSTKLAE